MKYENILFKKENTTITFNHPQVLNAMIPQSWSELHQAILELKKYPEVKVVILRGAGDRAFSAGVDLKARQKILSRRRRKKGQAIHECCRALMQSTKIAVGHSAGVLLERRSGTPAGLRLQPGH